MTIGRMARACAVVAVAAASSAALAEVVVFENGNDNGWYTPFNASTSPDIRYGDSGWITTGSAPPTTVSRMELGFAVDSSTAAGSTDITFTLNDGSPSGLVFGSGATLWSTTITNVALPDSSSGVQLFTLDIPIPNIDLLGGFNNVGWSIGVDNFSYDGNFGFQASSANLQTVGFYTNNASEFDGTNWSLFSFGPDPVFGVANFVATIYEVPEPTTLSLMVLGCLALRRRRA